MVLNQLTNGSHSSVTQMVDVVIRSSTIVDVDHPSNKLDDVVLSKSSSCLVKTQPAVELVTAYTTEVVFTIVEEQVIDELSCVFDTWRLARAEPTVELEKRFFLSRRCGVLGKCGLHKIVNRVIIDVRDKTKDFFVSFPAKCSE